MTTNSIPFRSAIPAAEHAAKVATLLTLGVRPSRSLYTIDGVLYELDSIEYRYESERRPDAHIRAVRRG